MERKPKEAWLTIPLKELIEFAIGGAWGSPPENADGKNLLEVACIRGTDFRDWDERKSGAAVSRALDVKSLAKRELKAGDILLEISGGGPEQPVGRTIMVDSEALELTCGRPMVPTNFLRLIRLNSGVDPAYVNHYLKYFYVTGNISDYQGGSNNLRNLRFKDYITIGIPLAPLPEQRRIVAAIETQLGRLDAAVASLHAAKAKLKRYEQAVLKAAVEGRLTDPDLVEGEIPEGWRIIPVEEVGQIVTGSTPSKSVPAYYGDDHPFYKPTDLEAGYETRESTDGLTDEGLGQARTLPAKSILVTCIGATIGKTGLIRIAGACNQQINAIVPNAELVPEYGYFHCISPYFQKQIKDNASATTLPLLNKSRFKVLDFILPSMADQLKIVSEVEHRFDRVGELESSLDTQLRQASRMRQSVLKRAFEGRLV